MRESAPESLGAPMLHPSHARLLLIEVRRAGVDVDGILAEEGASAGGIEQAAGLVPLSLLRRLVQALPASLQEGFGLRLGDLAPISIHGPLVLAATASSTLDEALRTVAAVGGSRGSTSHFRYAVSEHYGELELIERVDYGDLRQFALEASMLFMSKVIAAVVGQPLDGLVFRFPGRPPTWAGRYADYLPGQIQFGASRLGVRVPRAHLGLSCVAADPRAREAALRECEREAQALGFAARGDLGALIRSRLGATGDGFPSLEATAASMGLSTRTIMRRLRGEGLSYQGLIDETRADQACWRLAHTSDTIEQIAADLGFGDTSNFSRVFRRWRGAAPGEYRRSAKSGGAAPAGR